MARAHYRQTVISKVPASGVLQIIPNPEVTVFEANSAIALAQTIYAGPSGPSTIPNPFVGDEHGLVEFWLDLHQDVRLVVEGAASGLDDVDLVQEPVLPPASHILSRTTVVDDADWAITFQNEHALGKSFRVLDPDGWNVFNVQRSPGGRNVVSINMKNGSVPENNLFLVAENRVDTSVMADFELDNTGGGGTVDSTALRGVGRVSGGAGATRSLEAFTHRLAPATTNSTWGIGLTVFTDVVGLGPTYNAGIFLNGGAGLLGEVRNDAALCIAGTANWKYGYYQLANDNATMLANIDQNGKVTCGNISPRTDATYSLGSSNSDAWLAVYADVFAATANGSAAGPAYTFYAETTSGMFLSSAGVLGWSTVGGNRMALSASNLQLFVPMMLQQKTSMSVAAGYDGLFFKSDDFLYRQDSAANVVKIHDQVTIQPRARVRNSASQSIANNTLTAATFDTEVFDTDTIHSTSSNTNRLTATTAGTYRVTAKATFAANATGTRNVAIYDQSGVIYDDVWAISTGAGHPTSVTAHALVPMTAGQWVQMIVYQDSGGALNLSGGATYDSWFEMVRVSA